MLQYRQKTYNVQKGLVPMTRDMTTGSIPRHMLAYAVPLLFGNLFQQLYNTVDSLVVGRMDGKQALAAVGAAGPVMNILIFLIVGISMGASILMAEYFGAGDGKQLRAELATSVTAGLGFTLAISAAAVAGAEIFLRLTRIPPEILPQATAYLRIVATGLVFSFLYNILSAALRAVGDSRAPLGVLVLSSLLNILLDLLFVGGLGMGVRGAAYATVLSQAFSAGASLLYIRLASPPLRLGWADLRVSGPLLNRTIRFSSVSAAQQTVLYVGRILVQSAINPIGVDAVAAFNAGSIIDSYVLAPGDSLAASLTTFTAQNRGAGKHDRIPTGLKVSVAIGMSFCAVVAGLVFLFDQPLMRLFLRPEETAATQMGLGYLHLMALFYICTGVCNSFQGLFRGLGKLQVTLSATLVQIPIRVAITWLLVPPLGVTGAAAGVACGWLCMIAYELYAYRKHWKTTPQ